jgi:hypothetical protein
MAYARRRRRRNPTAVAVPLRRTTTTYQKSGGMFSSTEGKVMLVLGVAVVGVVGYFLLSGSG